MKVLVTGANGYIGTGIVKQLLNDGLEVIATDFKNTNVDKRAICIDANKMCEAIDYDTSTWICNDMGAWRIREAMPRSIMGTPTKYQFEDILIYGAENYDGYLKHLYGDWRQLPPKEKQVTHHDFVSLDLNRSYKIQSI